MLAICHDSVDYKHLHIQGLRPAAAVDLPAQDYYCVHDSAEETTHYTTYGKAKDAAAVAELCWQYTV